MRRRAAASLLGVAVLAGLTAAPPAAYAVPSPITAVAVAAGPFTVDGVTGTSRSTISVHVTDLRGVGACADEAGLAPNQVALQFLRTAGGSVDTASVYLPRTAGSATDGTFSAAWRLGSTRNGTWTLVGLRYCFASAPSLSEPSYSVDPWLLGFPRTVVVRGTHLPTVTVTRSPAVVDFGADQLVTFTYRTNSGVPLAGQRIVIGEDTACGFDRNGSSVRTTDAFGRVNLWYRDSRRCVYLANPVDPAHPDLGTFSSTTLLLRNSVTKYERFRSVTLQASASRLRVTRPVLLSGTVLPRYGTLWLQRAGGGGWATIASEPVPWRGLYSITLRLQANRAMALGPHRYRVVAVSPENGMAPTVSRVVVITGM